MSRFRKPSQTNDGFTLLEVVIAMAIMFVAFGSILSVESSSILTSSRAKQMTVVAMLARSTLTDVELKLLGKTFDETKKTDGGVFNAPFSDYRWTSEIKELKFPPVAAGGGVEKKKGDADAGDQATEMLTKLMTKYLSKAVREVNVTVHWKKGSGEQSFTVSSFWVDLNSSFDLSE